MYTKPVVIIKCKLCREYFHNVTWSRESNIWNWRSICANHVYLSKWARITHQNIFRKMEEAKTILALAQNKLRTPKTYTSGESLHPAFAKDECCANVEQMVKGPKNTHYFSFHFFHFLHIVFIRKTTLEKKMSVRFRAPSNSDRQFLRQAHARKRRFSRVSLKKNI